MTNIAYIGRNVIDVNTSIDKAKLGSIADVKESAEESEEGQDVKEKAENSKKGQKPHFSLREDKFFQLTSGNRPLFLNLYTSEEYVFDKNTEEKDWSISERHNGSSTYELSDCVIRPGGGATNNTHVAATLAESKGSDVGLELLVLDESKHTSKLFKNELGTNFSYDFVRPSSSETYNVNFRCNGEKITFSSSGKPFESSCASSLESKLREHIAEDTMVVVNSVKEPGYLNAILDHYVSLANKPRVVAAVTNSMLSKRDEGLDVDRLVDISDIYLSNIEELYDLLKDTVFKHRKGHHELDDLDLYAGMLHILGRQLSNGKEGRVYVSCGENGAVVMDSDSSLYFQKVSGLIESPTQRTEPIDLNGAGDTFGGVMTLLEAEEGYSVQEILDYANAAAQWSTRFPGANSEGRITVESLREFRHYHAQDIWKYDVDSGKFEREGRVNFNLQHTNKQLCCKIR